MYCKVPDVPLFLYFYFIQIMHPTPNKYNEKFQQALAQLNPEQLAAVNKMDGPVLVIAGPGTGKTQILAAKP